MTTESAPPVSAASWSPSANTLDAGDTAHSEMIAVVAHDLKNPVAIILMAATFLNEELIPNDAEHALERNQLEVIVRSAQRMNRLIHDLLDATISASGQITLHLSPTNPRDLLADAAELLQPLAGAKHLAVSVDIPAGLPAVAADRERILQVFSNIGGNAIKFTPPGGHILMCVAHRGSALEFSVSDDGPGIAAGDLPHLFERYWQATSSDHSGVGLGLPIARRIVEAHGGTVRASSQAGRGSCFTFSLPILAG